MYECLPCMYIYVPYTCLYAHKWHALRDQKKGIISCGNGVIDRWLQTDAFSSIIVACHNSNGNYKTRLLGSN